MEKRTKKKAVPTENTDEKKPVNPWDAMWGIQSDEEAHDEEVVEEATEEEEGAEDGNGKRDPWLW